MYGHDDLYNGLVGCPEGHDQGAGQVIVWPEKGNILQVGVSCPWREGTGCNDIKGI